MRPLCAQCLKKPIRQYSRFCTDTCAVEFWQRWRPRTERDIQGTKRMLADAGEDLALDGSQWCSSCRAWVFPDESRHLAHPYDSPSLPSIVGEY
jgi:hypothetical protein